VHKALARTPDDRYETGAQLVAALAETDAPEARSTAPEKSIAVLPFNCLTSDPDDAFLADGVTEEILNALAQIPGLSVAGRGSVFTFKGRNEDPRSVGAKLNVATVLEGTMRRAGNRLRVTVQLISTSDGYQLWSERYDRVLEDVFAVQDEIASAIAGRLRVSLEAARSESGARQPTQNMAAYQLYLKGRALLYQRGRSIALALDCFKQAVALDPDYAQAWAGVADGYTTSGYSGFAAASQVMPQGLAAARRAVALDPDLAEAHGALACALLVGERDYAGAEREFLRAIELNPNYMQARGWYGLFYLQWVCGREREAREQLQLLLDKDPLSAYAHFMMAFCLESAGQSEQAVTFSSRGLELDPNSYLGQWCHAVGLMLCGRYAEGERSAERALAISGRHVWSLCELASLYGHWGKRDEAMAMYQEAVARSAREYMQPSMLTIAAAAAGDEDAAMKYVQRALDEHDPLFVMIARAWPDFERQRKDQRFAPIVAQLGLPGYDIQTTT
jgi:serine/threonine-protein kinase